MKFWLLVLIWDLGFGIWDLTYLYAESIVNSKHNLSSSGPGEVKAVTESEICIFCHTPHNSTSQAPLWNRYDSGQIYIPYRSSTLKATTGQPTGASKLCLSCHDGTVALGLVRSRQEVIPFTQSITGEDNIGTDLSNDHPVSFVYNSALVGVNPQLKDPSTLPPGIRLDNNSELQCTGCHDPHNNQFGYFLNVNAIRGSLCLACHDMQGWSAAIHKDSTATWNGVSPDPWPHTPYNNVADNSCENCHNPHNATGKKRLLNASAEEDNCFSCHNGQVASKNILAEFNKWSAHPVMSTTGVHDPAEGAYVQNRHVECSDCHNPHAANNQDGDLPGSLNLVKGVTASGAETSQINYEYELCFRCHAETHGATPRVQRQFPQMNTRIEFDPSNASYHPVENVGRNPDVPSLIAPYTTSSIITCTDCHNNDTGPNYQGTGPNGPHGSINTPLLERNLLLDVNIYYPSPSVLARIYAMCFKCHSQTSLLAFPAPPDASFPYHWWHVVRLRYPCTACHDSHGMQNATHLINFDTRPGWARPNQRGYFSFEDLGRFHGRCRLTCHAGEHDPGWLNNPGEY